MRTSFRPAYLQKRACRHFAHHRRTIASESSNIYNHIIGSILRSKSPATQSDSTEGTSHSTIFFDGSPDHSPTLYPPYINRDRQNYLGDWPVHPSRLHSSTQHSTASLDVTYSRHHASPTVSCQTFRCCSLLSPFQPFVSPHSAYYSEVLSTMHSYWSHDMH